MATVSAATTVMITGDTMSDFKGDKKGSTMDVLAPMNKITKTGLVLGRNESVTSSVGGDLPDPNEPTSEELAWARAIRDAARADPTIQDAEVTDWEYLQHGIIGKDKVSKALQRIRKMQAFKQRYGIQGDGSVADAARDAHATMLLHPGFYVSMASTPTTPSTLGQEKKKKSTKKNKDSEDEPSVSDNQTEDSSTIASTAPASTTTVICLEYQKYRADNMKSEEAYAILLRADFYALQACHPNVPAMRGGTFFMADTQNAGLGNFSLTAETRCSELTVLAYPVRIQRIVVLYCNPVVRLFYTICRSFLSAKFQRMAMLLGVKGSQEFVAQPDVPPKESRPPLMGGTLAAADDKGEAYTDTLLQRLQERYNNAAKFQL